MKTLKPILFSTPMVQANLEGRKTQTRREVKVPKGYYEIATYFNKEGHLQYIEASNETGTDIVIIKPKYQVGDILWVRETWNHWGDGTGFAPKYVYRATDLIGLGHNWKPSIFMPKEAARILLKVTNLRVERLNDILETDAIDEGIELQLKPNFYKNYLHGMLPCPAVKSFETLWESINGKDSWNKNPFVWVYEYELTDKPKL